jgi:hypothetical protein
MSNSSKIISTRSVNYGPAPSLDSGYGFSIRDQSSIITFTYKTEEESKKAEEMMRNTIKNTIDIHLHSN